MLSPWLFDVYMDDVDQEINMEVLWRGLEQLRENGGRLEINQPLFVDDTGIVADSEEKSCRVVSLFG